MRLRPILNALVVLGGLAGGASTAKAQDWSDYLHWPYTPPQVPGNGFEYKPLYDKFYVYPREQRIVPQIQGGLYRNYYGGKRSKFLHINCSRKKRWYEGNHFTLDVF